MSERQVGGPTGAFPGGKIGTDDLGELEIGVGHQRIRDVGMVVINFFACVTWAEMPRSQALEFAATITAHAEMLAPSPYEEIAAHFKLPITVSLDERHSIVRLTLETPAHMVGLAKAGALRLAKQISDIAQKLPAEEMPA